MLNLHVSLLFSLVYGNKREDACFRCGFVSVFCQCGFFSLKEKSLWDQTGELPFGIASFEGKDRGIIAKRTIEAGEILYRERGFAWVSSFVFFVIHHSIVLVRRIFKLNPLYTLLMLSFIVFYDRYSGRGLC